MQERSAVIGGGLSFVDSARKKKGETRREGSKGTDKGCYIPEGGGQEPGRNSIPRSSRKDID